MAIDYYKVRDEEDPFLDTSTLDPLDYDRKDNINTKITKILEESTNDGLPFDKIVKLCQVVIKLFTCIARQYRLDHMQRLNHCA